MRVRRRARACGADAAESAAHKGERGGVTSHGFFMVKKRFRLRARVLVVMLSAYALYYIAVNE